ncbi:BH2950 [Halalkalibacterium halodurans C-125]|uniref:BH2950 protein n=1 Tax=Halalkalibacterium halodurans (strain ATCC BAA-125 / DSM 18197 / FERM 7344 / JCM 9153 / C-125) TaxID=272558 RepID=Q9K8Q3_HALH5|nr:BH2950 [Halalkalibacterium halodurans C-125]
MKHRVLLFSIEKGKGPLINTFN